MYKNVLSTIGCPKYNGRNSNDQYPQYSDPLVATAVCRYYEYTVSAMIKTKLAK